MLARGIPPIDLARPWGLQNLRMYSQDNLAAAAAAATTAVRLIGPNGANRRREYHTTPPPRRDLVPSNFLGMHKNFLNLMDELEKNLTPSVGNWGEEIWGPETANRDTRKGALRMFSPKVDVSETDKEFHVHCEVPGVDPKDLKVEFKGGVLSVRGEKKMEKKEEDKDKKYYRIERSSGKFSRSFRLENVDEKNISAKYKDGVLEIVVPKQQTQTQSNAIEIKTEGGQSQQQQQQDQKDQKDQKSESSSSSSQNKEGSQQYQGQQQHQQQHQQQQYQSEHPEGQPNKKSSYA